MIKILMALAMGAALVTGASAADIGGGKKQSLLDPVATEAPKASWTGPWISIGGGYTIGTITPDGGDSSQFGSSVEALTAEAALGFDYQIDRAVIGVSGCASYVDVDGAGIGYCVGGRGGVLLTDNSLLYLSGGYRWQAVDVGSENQYLSGPYVGTGIESRLNKNLSAKLEYQHVFYDSLGDLKFSDIGADVGENRILLGLTLRLGGVDRLY